MACVGCGAPSSASNPKPSACGKCPPRFCNGCGAMDSLPNPCACWLSLSDITLADAKALFSRDGIFTVDTGETMGVSRW